MRAHLGRLGARGILRASPSGTARGTTTTMEISGEKYCTVIKNLGRDRRSLVATQSGCPQTTLISSPINLQELQYVELGVEQRNVTHRMRFFHLSGLESTDDTLNQPLNLWGATGLPDVEVT